MPHLIIIAKSKARFDEVVVITKFFNPVWVSALTPKARLEEINPQNK